MAALAAPWAAATQERVYEYSIKHPVFGDIGTYVNRVKQTGERTEVSTAVDVAVKIAGNVVYRQEAERSEHWQGERLIEFRSTTAINDERIEVSGEARDGHFVVTSPQGTINAPADIRPSNPWSPAILESETILMPVTGRLDKVRSKQDRLETIRTLDGQEKKLRRYEIQSDKRQVIWFDELGVPLAFRTEEGGVNIDFILVDRRADTADSTPRNGRLGR